MRRQPIVLTMTVAFLALGGMGADCDSDDSPTGDGGDQTADCRDDGTCDPNRYADTDQGTYDTSNYAPRLIWPNAGGDPVGGVTDGEIVLVNAKSEGQDIQYWIVSEVTAGANPQPVDVFAGGDVFLNDLYVIVDETGAEVGDPIIAAAPDSAEYSPLFRKYEVEVPTGYNADALKSVAAIDNSVADDTTGVLLNETDEVYVLSIVDDSITLDQPAGGLGADAPEKRTFWFDGFQVYGFQIPGGQPDGSLAVTAVEGGLEPFLSDLYQIESTADGVCFGRNVYSAPLGDAEYSPVPVLHFMETSMACSSTATDDATLLDNVPDQYDFAGTDIIIVAPQAP